MLFVWEIITTENDLNDYYEAPDYQSSDDELFNLCG